MWCIIVLLEVAEDQESSRTQSSYSQQWKGDFKERSPSWYLADSLPTLHMLLQVNWHIPPCYHWWHLNVRLSTWLRCVPCSSQLNLILSLCPEDLQCLRLPFSEGSLRRMTFEIQRIYKRPTVWVNFFTFPEVQKMLDEDLISSFSLYQCKSKVLLPT